MTIARRTKAGVPGRAAVPGGVRVRAAHPGGIRVRAARSSERALVLELVQRLLVELGEEGEETGLLPVRRLIASWRRLGHGAVAFLAFDANEPVGVATLSESWAAYAGGRFGILNEMYVVPSHRSRRVGALLVGAARDHGKRRGWRRLDVTAPESPRWDRTRRFYEREGFVFTGPKLKLLL